ncbi:MAG: phosphatidylglycerophosphatase A [Acidobacteriales bacterium]|nr:phosphatidylglycerophosphatase A [Terriglobales bacterium]
MKTRSTASWCAHILATWFGCGLSPVAPGTAGSLAAVALAALVERCLNWPPWTIGLTALAALPLAVWAAGRAASDAGKEDPGFVVIDEVVGQWATLAGATASNWKALLAGFLLFRLFDIWKPVPVRQLEKLHGGIGIVADDVMAGVYGALVLYVAGCFNLY